jgi:hypothetical protein
MTPRIQLGKKEKTRRDQQGAWRQDGLTSGKTPVLK